MLCSQVMKEATFWKAAAFLLAIAGVWSWSAYSEAESKLLRCETGRKMADNEAKRRLLQCQVGAKADTGL